MIDNRDEVFRVLSTTSVYDGRIVHVRRDAVQLPDGKAVSREVVETSDAVGIVAINSSHEVCLVRQYRHAQRGFLWEIPAGRLDVKGERPLEAAKRELMEEAQLEAPDWRSLTSYASSAGFATERIEVFLALNARPASPKKAFVPSGEETSMRIAMRPFADVLKEAHTGGLQDAKTIIGLLLAEAWIQQ